MHRSELNPHSLGTMSASDRSLCSAESAISASQGQGASHEREPDIGIAYRGAGAGRPVEVMLKLFENADGLRPQLRLWAL